MNFSLKLEHLFIISIYLRQRELADIWVAVLTLHLKSHCWKNYSCMFLTTQNKVCMWRRLGWMNGSINQWTQTLICGIPLAASRGAKTGDAPMGCIGGKHLYERLGWTTCGFLLKVVWSKNVAKDRSNLRKMFPPGDLRKESWVKQAVTGIQR